MSTPFSDTVNNTGIVQQSRSLARVDATQWPTQKIANSANNWLDFLTGYAIGADTRFQWDDTNHLALPEGTVDLTADVSDYSFLTDEQGNSIITLIGLSRLEGTRYIPLKPVDRNDPFYHVESFGTVSGSPEQYDKIADNIVRLDKKSPTTIEGGLKFYFQRTPSYFDASSTTKSPGFSPLLHRGFIIASAYDIALTLGLPNLSALAVERQREEERVVGYFAIRRQDETPVMKSRPILHE